MEVKELELHWSNLHWGDKVLCPLNDGKVRVQRFVPEPRHFFRPIVEAVDNGDGTYTLRFDWLDAWEQDEEYAWAADSVDATPLQEAVSDAVWKWGTEFQPVAVVRVTSTEVQ